MGVIISAIAVASKSIKKSHEKKKAEKAQKKPPPQDHPGLHVQPSEPFPSTQGQAVHDVQRGLRDEHLAAVPPPLGIEAGAELEGAGTKDVERRVAVEAPVPLPTSTSALKPPVELTQEPDRPTTVGTVAITEEENTKAKGDKMASDEDYSAFLDKANEDPSKGVANTQSKNQKVELKAVDSGVEVPAVLKKVTKDAFYVSDADEPFVPVCLKGAGKGLPDEATFAKLVNHPSPDDAEVSIMDIGEWDPQGQYKDVVDATREVAKGSDIRVYRVEREGSRVEYWVIGIDGGKLVGVKALAVES